MDHSAACAGCRRLGGMVVFQTQKRSEVFDRAGNARRHQPNRVGHGRDFAVESGNGRRAGFGAD